MEGLNLEENTIAHTEHVQRTTDIQIKSLTPFSEMQLSAEVRAGLKKCGYEYPTVLQASAISMGIVGLDLIVQAKSGTGKTLVFSTVLLNNYRPKVGKPQSLIITPTREIAVQITDILNSLGTNCAGFQAMCAIGGIDVMTDRKRLAHARAVVGTPGRLLHLINSKLLNTTGISLLVLDEADKLFTDTLLKDVLLIIQSLSRKRQTMCCSATLGNETLHEHFNNIMSSPLLIAAEKQATVLVGVKQFAYALPPLTNSAMEISAKLRALEYIFSSVSFKQCIVFAGSQTRAVTYYTALRRGGWACAYMCGAQEQTARLEIFRAFREGKINILIATDLMSRGIDLSQLNLVVNLDLPNSLATYMHRTGRGGRFGTYAITVNVLASHMDYSQFKGLMQQNNYGMHILKFPHKCTQNSLAETRNIWDFSDLQQDINYYGAFDIHNYEDLETTINSLTLDTNTFSVNESEEQKLEEATQTFSVKLEEPQDEEELIKDLPSSNTIDDASSLVADESIPSIIDMDWDQIKQLYERIKPLLKLNESCKPDKEFLQINYFEEYNNFKKNLKNSNT